MNRNTPRKNKPFRKAVVLLVALVLAAVLYQKAPGVIQSLVAVMDESQAPAGGQRGDFTEVQQDSIRKLRFSAKKTMLIAQQLYEGIELGPGGPVGLITYMRTDSTRIAKEAADEALDFIRRKFGDDYALKSPRFFKNRKKAQDAHEAIRPTSVTNTPEKLAPYLSKDQQSLYRLIWQRFVASQMQQALINQVSVTIGAGPYQFAASGSTVKFPGFMALYMSAEDELAEKGQKETPALQQQRSRQRSHPGVVA